MGLLSRFFGSSTVKAAEGQYREGPYMLPVSGGWLSNEAGQNWNWWQMGYDVERGSTAAMVEACVSAYSQTIAMCPGTHWWSTGDGGRERVINSALTRILRRPNNYQSISDFLLNLTRNLYMEGNAYVLALRNDRQEISELHLTSSSASNARIAVTGDIFYYLSGNELVERRFGKDLLVPSRDVLHLRLHTPRHPLQGDTPLVAAALDVATGNAMAQQQLAFYLNQARPSYVLSTDSVLTREQMQDLRERWNEQSQGLNAGKTPILSSGMKPLPMTSKATDDQLAEMLKMTEQHIALAFRVPLQILGIGGTPYASTELLMQSWIASGLGFALNHIEEAFGQLFNLKGFPEEYIEFDTRALLRSAHKDRIEALAKGVISGIYAPNEARRSEDLPDVEFGEDPRVQQQVVPLSFGAKLEPSSPTPAAPVVENPPEVDPPAPAKELEPKANVVISRPDDILNRLYDHASSLH